jgi:hypothetical protein
MARFLVTHLIYLALAVWLYRRLLTRVATWPALKRRIAVTGGAAVLFSPGLFWYFAFAIPTFALLAPFLHVLQFIYDGHAVASMFPWRSWVLPQVLASVVPICFAWGVLFVVAQLIANRRNGKESHA